MNDRVGRRRQRGGSKEAAGGALAIKCPPPQAQIHLKGPIQRHAGCLSRAALTGKDVFLGKDINCSTQQVGRNGLETFQDSCKVLQGKPTECNGIPFSERLSACVGWEGDYRHEAHGAAIENTQLQQRADRIPQILLVCLRNAN